MPEKMASAFMTDRAFRGTTLQRLSSDLETSISELAPLIINALMTIAIINQVMEKLLAKKKFFMIVKKVLAIFRHKIITTKSH